MKKFVIAAAAMMILTSACSLFKETLKIDDVVKEKARIDSVENPALKSMIKDDLGQKLVEIKNVTVKEVVNSSNIDYDFCLIVDILSDGKRVECHVYSKNVYTLSKLENGKTKVDIKGRFGKFFSMLDDYYTKVEILEASIEIIKPEEVKAE